MKETSHVPTRRNSDISDEERQQLKLGKWRIDCPIMRLRSRVGSPTKTYFGPGYIYQPAPDQLSFHLYASRFQRDFRSGWLDLAHAGELLPEEAYFDLDVWDAKGRRWKAKRVLPGAIERTALGKVIVEGPLTALTTTATLSRTLPVRGHSMSLWVFQELDLPWNTLTLRRTRTTRGGRRSRGGARDAWVFKSQGLDIFARLERGEVLVEAFSKRKSLHPRIVDCVRDALEFVVGDAVRYQLSRVRRGRVVQTTVRSAPPGLRQARWQPPLAESMQLLPATKRITSRYHRRLFDRFLAHRLSATGKVHSISGQLAALREASAARYINAYALTMTSVVESLTHSDVKARVRVPPARDVASLLKWTKAWTGPEELKARAFGALSNLRQVRAGDKLRALLRRGVISGDQYSAWQRLRNRSSHGFQLLHGNPDEIRELLPHVQVLFYRLVFLAIGYRGPFTDYSARGWPTRMFP